MTKKNNNRKVNLKTKNRIRFSNVRLGEIDNDKFNHHLFIIQQRGNIYMFKSGKFWNTHTYTQTDNIVL